MSILGVNPIFYKPMKFFNSVQAKKEWEAIQDRHRITLLSNLQTWAKIREMQRSLPFVCPKSKDVFSNSQAIA